MQLKPETKFARLLKEVHGDLQRRIQMHQLQMLKYSTVLGEVAHAFKMIDQAGTDDQNMCFLLRGPKTMRELNQQLALIDPIGKELSQEHEAIVHAVIAFNHLVLSCNDKLKHYFITFDTQVAAMFEDVHISMLGLKQTTELAIVIEGVRVKRKYTRRQKPA